MVTLTWFDLLVIGVLYCTGSDVWAILGYAAIAVAVNWMKKP